MNATPLSTDGSFDGALHRLTVRAQYEDTDLSGMVYHANYLKWFERARSDLLRCLNIDQRAAYEAGEGAFTVSEMLIRYRAPARLDDAVRIESLPTEVAAASCRMIQRALRGTTLLAEAQVRVCVVGGDGRPRRLPLAWRAAFDTIMALANAAPAADPTPLPARS